jgi:hypothetical protein
MKELLCKAFCDNLNVRNVPLGFAVKTPFVTTDGDSIGFYLRKLADGGYRIEDSGVILPTLEADGLDLRTGSRGEAMAELLEEYRVAMDSDDRQFVIDNLQEEQVPAAALRFVAFSLRVRDFALMTEARVVSSFRDDVKRLLAQTISDRAEIAERSPLTSNLADFPADFVLRAPGRVPVGVYLATGDAHVMEAAAIQMRALYETKEPCSVIALVERGRSLTANVRRYASNRLTALTEFRGDEIASVARIVQEALGQPGTIH